MDGRVKHFILQRQDLRKNENNYNDTHSNMVICGIYETEIEDFEIEEGDVDDTERVQYMV